MREARHERGRVLPSPPGQRFHKVEQQIPPGARAIRDEKPEVQGHLIVAASARVQLLAHVAHQLREPALDIHVHVLALAPPRERPGLYLFALLLQAPAKRVRLLMADDSLAAHHAGVGDGAGDILPIQRLIKRHGFGVFFHQLVSAALKPPAPQLAAHTRSVKMN